GSVEVVRQRYDGDLGARHDAGRVLSLLRLAVEVRHGPGVACGQPTVELGSVRVRLESGNPDRVEPQREPSTLHLDAFARRLCATPLRDVFFHKCIVSRRHRANRTTSSTGGTAASSPNAVYLNACSLGALGDRTRRRIAEFFDLWQARGASAWYDVWWAALSELRARYARVVGASPEEIALAPSVSVALSAVAEALDYRRRPKVVVTSLDF